MEHTHNYETLEHHAVSPEAREIGIREMEIRKCKGCGKVATFISAHDKWVPLLEETTSDEKNILLA